MSAMGRNRQSQYAYAREKMMAGTLLLATGSGSLEDRLASVIWAFHPLEAEQVPASFQGVYRAVAAAYTEMSPKEAANAEETAEEIVGLTLDTFECAGP